ncbi:MAG: hypothetical protein BWY10_02571 [Chloroflexi bacterium ADurb.Bin180]|nr:MAG: hypothetical protein BWY10_02571 [Chloroflexi bacterium ADurb.Bin180]
MSLRMEACLTGDWHGQERRERKPEGPPRRPVRRSVLEDSIQRRAVGSSQAGALGLRRRAGDRPSAGPVVRDEHGQL